MYSLLAEARFEIDVLLQLPSEEERVRPPGQRIPAVCPWEARPTAADVLSRDRSILESDRNENEKRGLDHA